MRKITLVSSFFILGFTSCKKSSTTDTASNRFTATITALNGTVENINVTGAATIFHCKEYYGTTASGKTSDGTNAAVFMFSPGTPDCVSAAGVYAAFKASCYSRAANRSYLYRVVEHPGTLNITKLEGNYIEATFEMWCTDAPFDSVQVAGSFAGHIL